MKIKRNTKSSEPYTPLLHDYRNDVSTNSIHENKPVVNTSNKKTSTDAEYISAVKRGDMETAQRMVDEAAKKAGYTDNAYVAQNKKEG